MTRTFALLATLTMACSSSTAPESQDLLASIDSHAAGELSRAELDLAYEEFAADTATLDDLARAEQWRAVRDGMEERGFAVDDYSRQVSDLACGENVDTAYADCLDKAVSQYESCLQGEGRTASQCMEWFCGWGCAADCMMCDAEAVAYLGLCSLPF
jgi:hypothetical protein